MSDIYKLEVFNIYESVMKQELFGNEMEKIGNLWYNVTDRKIVIWKVDYNEEKNFFDFNVIIIFDDRVF